MQQVIGENAWEGQRRRSRSRHGEFPDHDAGLMPVRGGRQGGIGQKSETMM